LPAFFEDTYFSAFEEQAFAMEQPGQISPVFAGPGGVYLQQLVEQHPPRNIPIATVAGEIRHRLQRDHVRYYFQYFMRQFAERNITLNQSVGWQYMHLDAPIAQVNSVSLLRPAFLRYYGDPTTVDYTVRWDLVLGGAGDWIEGETLMQDLEAKGLAGHPWIVRAGELAATLARADRTLAMAIPVESHNTPETALATLARQPDFAAGLRSVRVAELSIMTTGLESMMPSQRRATVRLAEAIDKQLDKGEIPVQPRPLRLAGLMQAAGGDSAAALKSLRDQIKQTEWPGIVIKVGEPEWHDLVPGTAWSAQLRGVEPGEVSPSRTIGNLSSRHLVLEARPLDLTAQKARPLVLQTLAYEAAAVELIKQALGEVKTPGVIEFSFPVAAARPGE
jgi:hypothetical protein